MVAKGIKVIVISVIAGAVLLSGAGRALASGADPRHWREGSMKPDFGRREPFKGLNLTEAQKALLEQNKNKHREQMKAVSCGMHEKMGLIRQELQKDELDMSKINRLNSELKQAQAQMLDLRLADILEVRKILTPEQFKKFMANMKPGEGRFRDKWKIPGK